MNGKRKNDIASIDINDSNIHTVTYSSEVASLQL